MDMFLSFRLTHVQSDLAGMAARRRNEAKPTDLSKAIRANLPRLDRAQSLFIKEEAAQTEGQVSLGKKLKARARVQVYLRLRIVPGWS